jgi:parvulin-like peptidyl-prolyl isomerase
VLVEVPAKAGAEEIERRRARAERARAEAVALPAGERNLGAVAQRHSDDAASRYTGGELGWLYAGQAESYRWGREVVDAAFALAEKGALSPVLRAPAGFFFVKLADREEAAPAPLESVRAGIRARMLKEKSAALRERFFARLLGGLAIQSDPSRVDGIEPLAPPEKPELVPPPLPGG